MLGEGNLVSEIMWRRINTLEEQTWKISIINFITPPETHPGDNDLCQKATLTEFFLEFPTESHKGNYVCFGLLLPPMISPLIM